MNIYQKFWRLLDRKQKYSSVRLIFLTILGAVFEAAGVGLIIPFISVIAADDIIIPNLILNAFPTLNSFDNKEIIIGMVIIFLIFYFLKSLYLLFLVTVQSAYYNNLQQSITEQLFGSYLKRPYSYHLQHNSAKLLSNTITEAMQFAVGFTANALLVVNDLLIIIAVMAVLIYSQPVAAMLGIIVFGVASLLLFRISKGRSELYGKTRQIRERERIKSVQQGFGGIKDIKLFGVENIFKSSYAKETHVSLEAGRKQTILQSIPRIFLEFVAISSLCALIIFVTLSDDKANIIALIGLFVAAVFKLLPTVARLVQSAQAMAYTRPVVSFMYTELVENEHSYSINMMHLPTESDVSFLKNINISGLSFNYESIDFPALDDINLNIEAGSMTGFIGTSGAGKSTLIDCLLGLIQPSSGGISIDGKLITSDNVHNWQKKLGYVSQVIYLLDGSLRENIGFGIPSKIIDEEKIRIAVEKSQLTDFIASLPDGLDTVVGERGVRLSGGQRQRIGIARALYNNPPVLILDEATSSLDTATESEVMRSVEELQGSTTVLIIAHRHTTIENCDYLYKLDKGKIVAHGKPNAILGK